MRALTVYRPQSLTQRRRDLRTSQTDAERVLWYHLGDRQLSGAKFRRQHAIGSFVVDFYCPQARLAVELDGNQHAEPEHEDYDARRSAYLTQQGIRVLRFPNYEVLANIDSVLAAIQGALTLPSPTVVGEG